MMFLNVCIDVSKEVGHDPIDDEGSIIYYLPLNRQCNCQVLSNIMNQNAVA